MTTRKTIRPSFRLRAWWMLAACLPMVLTLPLQAAMGWSGLADFPQERGLAATFAGVSAEGHLVVAGGTNFPEAPPWEGGAKAWHDRIHVLEDPAGTWREAGRLPQALAHGVSIDTPDGLVCIGGCDAEIHHRRVFRLHVGRSGVRIEDLPPLPEPVAYAAGALVNGVIHVAGGSQRPEDVTASARLYLLDLSRSDEGWKQGPPLPGAGRILPVAAARGDAFFLFSGAELMEGADGRPQRRYLRDAWRYRKATGWQRLADLPRAAVAAASPAPALGLSHFFVISGDDGSLVDFEPKSAHPGFPRGILQYDQTTDTWCEPLLVPERFVAPVVVPAVRWRGSWVLPGGEARPAVRTRQVVALRPEPRRADFGWLNWTVVLLYLGGMIGIGVWFMKREAAATTDAYFRGGQRVPAWVAGLSIFATMLSSLTFMGIPARAYQTDVSWYIGQLPILLIAPLVAFCYLPFFRKLDLTSAYEYLEKRFHLGCRLFAAFSFLLLHLGRIAIVLYLPALALAAVSDIDVTTSILVIGLLCVIYTVIGGIQAVVWTDAIQALVLLGGALLCFVLAVWQVDGGLGGMAGIARADAKLLESLRWNEFSIADGTGSALVLFVAFFFNSLIPYTSSQDVVQRYVTTRDIAAARRSLWLTMVMSILGSMLFFGMGVAIYAFYKTHPAQLDPGMAAGDSILPYFIMSQLPAGVAGLLIAAIFAASQSTASSSLNSMATSFIKDVDARLLRPGRDDKTYLRTAQAVVVIAGLLSVGVAVWMAKSNIESAFKTFNTLIGLTAGSLGGLFALGVFTRAAHGRGALAGAVAGFATVLSLHLGKAPVSGLLYGFIGFATCFGVGLLCSILLPAGPGGDRGLSLRGKG